MTYFILVLSHSRMCIQPARELSEISKVRPSQLCDLLILSPSKRMEGPTLTSGKKLQPSTLLKVVNRTLNVQFSTSTGRLNM